MVDFGECVVEPRLEIDLLNRDENEIQVFLQVQNQITVQ